MRRRAAVDRRNERRPAHRRRRHARGRLRRAQRALSGARRDVGALRLAGDTIADCRIGYGGMAAVPQRAQHAEAVLRGKQWTEASAQAAADALTQDFKPLSDMRSSAEYRMNVARNLIHRFWLETR